MSILRWLGRLLATGILALVLPTPGSAIVPSAPAVSLPTTSTAASPGHPVVEANGVYLSPNLDPSRPASLLVALHGYAGSGGGIAGRLCSCADQYGWVVLAPTMAYR